jgi:hypothetical protein
MPIYVLGVQNRRVQIPNRPLAVTITGSVQQASLVIDADAEQRVMSPSPHLAVLPDVTQSVSIGVVCVGNASQFSADTVVNLAIGHDTPDELDPVQVIFDPVDLEGKGRVELARVTRRADGIEVTAGAAADKGLTPLASAARTSARKATDPGVHSAHGSLLVAIDASASMAPVFAAGSAGAATDIIVGVADALGFTDLSAVLVGDDVIPISCPDAARLAEAVTQAQPRWCAGARWSRLGDGVRDTVVCSDFPTTLVRQRFPVMALSADRRLDEDCVRVPPPRPGRQAGPDLIAEPAALDRITAALVRALS